MRCWTPLLRHPTRTACFALSLLGSSPSQQQHRLHPRGGLPGSSLILAMAASSGSGSGSGSSGKDFYRADGVRMGYDPYSPELRAKYGAPGATDQDGFNPYADSVGPGIYGGNVVRDDKGEIVIGAQYQNHNPRPGPVYAGGGYAPIIAALKIGEGAVKEILDAHSELVNEVTTGGATPLHMCGMSRQNQLMTKLLIERGGDIEAVDTYGYRPLHRMASNNLAVGAKALLDAGADPKAEAEHGETPMQVARSSAAWDVVQVLIPYYT